MLHGLLVSVQTHQCGNHMKPAGSHWSLICNHLAKAGCANWIEAESGGMCCTGGPDQGVAHHVFHHCSFFLLLQQLHHELVQLCHLTICGAPL